MDIQKIFIDLISIVIIGLFLIYVKSHMWSLFILSGMINIIIFHFIEAFLAQKKLLHSRGVNV